MNITFHTTNKISTTGILLFLDLVQINYHMFDGGVRRVIFQMILVKIVDVIKVSIEEVI